MFLEENQTFFEGSYLRRQAPIWEEIYVKLRTSGKLTKYQEQMEFHFFGCPQDVVWKYPRHNREAVKPKVWARCCLFKIFLGKVTIFELLT